MLLMERKTLVEHVKQVSEENAVQKPKKGRSQAEKIGRNKWITILVQRALDEIKQLRQELAERDRKIWEELKQQRVMQRAILQGFRGADLIKYTPPMLQRIACKDAVDLAIVESVRRAASPGDLPKMIAVDIDVDAEMNKRRPYGLKYYQVSRRIVRMNERLFDELGECLFEKRGLKWALSSFAFEVWGETEKEELVDRAGFEPAASELRAQRSSQAELPAPPETEE